MKIIAISSEGPTMTDLVDPRFGRAAGFAIVDISTGTLDYLDNGTSQAMAQGAGIQAAEQVIRSGARVVLTGYVGPKAFKMLSAAGITVIQDMGGCTIQQALERFESGQVTVATQHNKQGHWK